MIIICAGSTGLEMPHWRPVTVPGDWLAIDLLAVYSVTKLAIQGNLEAAQNVKKFKLSYSADGETWTSLRDNRGAELVRLKSDTCAKNMFVKFVH